MKALFDMARDRLEGGRDSSENAVGPERGVARLVRALLLFESAMWSAVTPVLPHYARALHAGKPALGVLVAAYPAGMVPGALVGAWIATRAGVRRTTLLGLLLFAASIAGFGFGTRIGVLDALRFVQGAGCGLIWGGGLTWVIAVAPRERRGAVLGSVFGAATFGTLLGPILGTLATALGTAGVFAAVGAVSLGLAAWTTRHPAPGPAPAEEARDVPLLRALVSSRHIRLGFWLILLEAGTLGALGALLPLRLGHLGASGTAIGATYAAGSVLAMLLSAPIGRLVDRRGPRLPLTGGVSLTAALLMLLTLPHTWPLLAVAGAIALGGPLTAYTIPAMSLITRAAERALIPLAVATLMLNLSWAAGETLGAPAAAASSQATSDAVPLLALAAIMVLTLVPVLRVAPSRPPAAVQEATGGTDPSPVPAVASAQPSTGSSVTSRATSAA